MKHIGVPAEIFEFENGEKLIFYKADTGMFEMIPVFSTVSTYYGGSDEVMLRAYYEMAVKQFTKKLIKSILTNNS